MRRPSSLLPISCPWAWTACPGPRSCNSCLLSTAPRRSRGRGRPALTGCGRGPKGQRQTGYTCAYYLSVYGNIYKIFKNLFLSEIKNYLKPAPLFLCMDFLNAYKLVYGFSKQRVRNKINSYRKQRIRVVRQYMLYCKLVTQQIYLWRLVYKTVTKIPVINAA